MWALSSAKCSTASACNNPSDSLTEIVRLEQFDYYNQKQNEVLYVNMENMNFVPPIVPSLVFARETCTPYWKIPNDCICLSISAQYSWQSGTYRCHEAPTLSRFTWSLDQSSLHAHLPFTRFVCFDVRDICDGDWSNQATVGHVITQRSYVIKMTVSLSILSDCAGVLCRH